MTNKDKLMKLLKSYGVTEYYADFDENEKYPNGNIIPIYNEKDKGELSGKIYSIYTPNGLLMEDQYFSSLCISRDNRYFTRFVDKLTRREVV